MLGFRDRISVTTSGFRGGRNGIWVGFSLGFTLFPPPFLHFIPPFLHIHLIHFISSASVMVRQGWSAGVLAIHRPSIKRRKASRPGPVSLPDVLPLNLMWVCVRGGIYEYTIQIFSKCGQGEMVSVFRLVHLVNCRFNSSRMYLPTRNVIAFSREARILIGDWLEFVYRILCNGICSN